MQTYEYILVALSVGQLLAMIVGGYIFFSKPAEKANDKINVMASNCILKHSRIDEVLGEMREKFRSIDTSLTLIKENDIKHIEQEMRRMSDSQTEILAILRYKEGVDVGK